MTNLNAGHRPVPGMRAHDPQLHGVALMDGDDVDTLDVRIDSTSSEGRPLFNSSLVERSASILAGHLASASLLSREGGHAGWRRWPRHRLRSGAWWMFALDS